MSRQYNPAIDAYRNMDIENLPKDEPKKENSGLLTKRTETESKIDMNNPGVRVAKQMQILRKHRDEIKNA
tara:strand:+ start:1998 stop:2207 length:210 start_codon:yes stop_codon:yes gene_type:complete